MTTLQTYATPPGRTAPQGYPHLIGYHGTNDQRAQAILAGGSISLLVGGGELNDGVYFTPNLQYAQLYARRASGNIAPGTILMVFCDGIFAGLRGAVCDPANYPNPQGMNLDPIIPPKLLALPFLIDANISDQRKTNLPFLHHLKAV